MIELFHREMQQLNQMQYRDTAAVVPMGFEEYYELQFPQETINFLLKNFCSNHQSLNLVAVFKLCYELEVIFKNWQFVRGPRGFNVHHYQFFKVYTDTPSVEHLQGLVKNTLENFHEIAFFLDKFKVKTNQFEEGKDYFAVLTALAQVTPSLSPLLLCLDNACSQVSAANEILDNKICSRYEGEAYILGIRDKDSGFVYVIAPEVQRYFFKIRANFEDSFWRDF